MQQFFLFFTMLIFASKAFQNDFYESQILSNVKRKTSRYLPKTKHFKSNNKFFFRTNSALPENNDQCHKVLIPVHVMHDSFKTYVPRFFDSNYVNNKMFCKKNWNHSPIDLEQSHKYLKHNLHNSRLGLPCPYDYLPLNFIKYPRHLCHSMSRNKLIMNKKKQNVSSYPRLKLRNYLLNKKKLFKGFRKNYINDFRTLRKHFINKPLIVAIKKKRSTKKYNLNPQFIVDKKEKLENTFENFAYRNLTHLNSDILLSQEESKDQENNSSTEVPTKYSSEGDSLNNVTQPTVTVSKINFMYPYKTELHESFERNRNIGVTSFDPVQLSSLKSVESSTVPTAHDLLKLTKLLEDLENKLRNEYVEPVATKSIRKTNETEVTLINDTLIKDQIDKVAIPLLSQISRELSLKNISEGEKTTVKSIESVDKEEGKQKTKEKEKDKDKKKEKKTDKKASKDKGKEKSKSTEKTSNKTKKSKSKKRDFGCRAEGTWLSTALGIEISITMLRNKMLKVNLGSTKSDGLINSKWIIQGLTLSKRGGPLILAAIYPQKKRIASFVGQCKVCQEEDIIFGSWTITKCVSKCTDVWMSTDIKLDIFRRKKAEQA